MKGNLPNRKSQTKVDEPQAGSASQSNTRAGSAVAVLAISLIFGCADHGLAAVRYVDASSANPMAPYTTWETAARAIQDAVDAAVSGDEIVVTNGIYATGGRAVFGTMTNRVAVTIPLMVRSVNGALHTIIEGKQMEGWFLFGDGAVRCVYLGNGASLSGFTLTKGATQGAGDQLHEESGGGIWCQSNASVSNCIISGNAAYWWGGGAYGGTLNNCLILGNSVTNTGGGACSNVLNNCTVVGNTSLLGAGGVANGFLRNSIIQFNTGGFREFNYSGSFFDHCCTTPLPFAGFGNFAGDPRFVNLAGQNLRLAADSPCINTGTNLFAPTGPDLDGNPRIFGNRVDLGAYEYQGSPVDIAPYITSDPTNVTVAAGSPATFFVTANGTEPLSYQWRFHGTNLPGRTEIVLSLTGVQLANEGPYFAVVTNLFGAATSSVAMLTVTNAPPPPPGTHYVDVNSANPAPPYNTWATAARVIQDAVDVASAGDEIVVGSGLYNAGGRAVHGFMTNRVAVDKPLRLRSVNGPSTTVIEGRQVPGITNGDGAIRCVYLANGSSLTGFTLRNGATRMSGDFLAEQSGGGVWCGNTGVVSVTVSVKDCVFEGNSAANSGGGAYQGVFGNCSFMRNSSVNGGGAAWATLTNCIVAGNSARYGGGVVASKLEVCTVFTNTATMSGGGAHDGTLFLCTISGNSAQDGGGVYGASLTNCFVSGNQAVGGVTNLGGGSFESTLNNCLIASNAATLGGGSYKGTLIGCTVVENSATVGGGAWNSALKNSILWINSGSSGSNYYNGDVNPTGTLDYCCAAPLPASGAGNISTDPLFQDTAHGIFRLQSTSPCVDAGLNTYVGGGVYFDLEWHPRIVNGIVDMGAYEVTNPPPSLPYITQQPENQSGTVGSDVTFTVEASGTPVLAYQWRHEGQPITGATSSSLALDNIQFSDAGKYSVVVSNSAGTVTSADAVLTVNPPISHYVDLNSPNPTQPYSTWETAAHTIQDAVDAAAPLEEVVVTNGVYATGGRAVDGTLTNRVALTKRIILRSVNGPEFTIIQGYQVPGTTNGDGAVRCVYMTNGANLVGFTLTNGATRDSGDFLREQSGGGVFLADYAIYQQPSPFVSNCVLVGNSVAGAGGGACGALGYGYGGQLDNCLLSGNSSRSGGGTAWTRLNNCRLAGNTAIEGGGSSGSTLNNCLLKENSASSYGGGAYGYGTLNNCIITGNSARFGGGCYSGTMNNCTIVGNSAQSGGGASGIVTNTFLQNCIVYYNEAAEGSNYFVWGGGWYGLNSMTYCCTAPEVPYSTGNFTNEPVFVDLAGGDFRLQETSPCIDSGNNSYAHGATDFAGDPRIVNGYVDVGAYEFSGTPIRSTRYVSADSATPEAPYTTWETAAQTIQDAIDAAAPGDEILVTNGVYATGGRLAGAYDTATNRVLVNKRVALRSVNGPEFTVIAGSGDISSRDVPRIRCVWLADGATLSGFTITNGMVDGSYVGGGGVYCQTSHSVVSNCVLLSNVSFWSGGGVYGGTVQNSILKGNRVTNSYSSGGGAASSVLSSCVLISNTAWGTTQASGAGASSCTLYNCTVVGNETFAPLKEAAVSWCKLTNSIVYFNTAAGGMNHINSTLAYSCTTPLPSGSGNISADPLFADFASGDLHLSLESPCLNVGNNDAVQGTTDLDGKPRILAGGVDLGAYEVGGTVHYVDVNSQSPVPPYISWETAATVIQDAVDVAVPGDEVLVADGVYATGGRAVYGTMTNRVAVIKPLNLLSVNGPEYTIIEGYQVPGFTNGNGAIRCVYLTNGCSLIGFTLTHGGTMATPPGTPYLLLGGGVYCEGNSAIVSNCIITGNSAYEGGGAGNAELHFCLVMSNSATYYGGGTTESVLSNCRVIGNSRGGSLRSALTKCLLSENSDGGAAQCTLENCLVINNSGPGASGGFGTHATPLPTHLRNCTVTGNSGGGITAVAVLHNCIVYYNKEFDIQPFYMEVYNCCSTPVTPEVGSVSGIITNEPMFLDLGKGDFRLQPGSPCINAGDNNYAPPGPGFDGNPRIVGGTVDIGAYEFQGSDPTPLYDWLARYGLPTDGSADEVDSDNDGLNNWQEWRAGTNPTNALSALRLLSPVVTDTNVAVSWESVAGMSYFLERGATMWATNQGAPFAPIVNNLPGQAGTTTFLDTNAIGSPGRFYRVGVKGE